MALKERSLIDLQRRLAEVLGDDHAMTLMRYLPQEEVATKSDATMLRSDIAALEERFDLKLEALEHRVLATMRAEMVSQTRTFVFVQVGTMTTLAALAFAAARLT